eukprot:TRINITY_DN27319_c0_g1_i4.p1 TRINITY_DN27319_c0_g1~~TRINITY_DN27319_c0_g1_i4.p1  ORF type:complete len:811 (-),score=157.75 TRINITY_DN27319_c0_g1_i4:116-2548(-)
MTSIHLRAPRFSHVAELPALPETTRGVAVHELPAPVHKAAATCDQIVDLQAEPTSMGETFARSVPLASSCCTCQEKSAAALRPSDALYAALGAHLGSLSKMLSDLALADCEHDLEPLAQALERLAAPPPLVTHQHHVPRLPYKDPERRPVDCMQVAAVLSQGLQNGSRLGRKMDVRPVVEESLEVFAGQPNGTASPVFGTSQVEASPNSTRQVAVAGLNGQALKIPDVAPNGHWSKALPNGGLESPRINGHAAALQARIGSPSALAVNGHSAGWHSPDGDMSDGRCLSTSHTCSCELHAGRSGKCPTRSRSPGNFAVQMEVDESMLIRVHSETETEADELTQRSKGLGTGTGSRAPGRSCSLKTLDAAELSNGLKDWLRMKSRTDFDAEGPAMLRDRESLFFVMEEYTGWRRKLQELLMSHPFDIAIGLVIAVNAITIGVETSLKADGTMTPAWLRYLEDFFLFIYTAELVARMIAFGLRAFSSNWVRFDAFLVCCGILDQVFWALGLDGGGTFILQKVMLVRLLRLARLARLVRLVVRFRVLWLLVQGLLHSINTLIWTFVIILILLYMFAVLALELIAPDESMSERYNDIVEVYFGSLTAALLTLLQVLTLDSIGGIYRPLILAKPWLFFYFMAFLLICSIALMNLITALMVESAMTQAQGDREANKAYTAMKRKQMIVELQRIFSSLDADESGMIDFEELMSADQEVLDHLQELVDSDDPAELKHVFRTLDYDRSGAVGINAFCEGLMRIQDGKPMEMTCIMRQCTDILHQTRALVDHLDAEKLLTSPLTPSQAARPLDFPAPSART